MFVDTVPPSAEAFANTARVSDVVVTAARLPPAAAEAAFSTIRLNRETLERNPRVDEALRDVPAVSLFRRASSASANPTTQGLSLRAIAPSGAGRALVTLDGVPINDPFGGWVIWAQAIPEGLDSLDVVRGAGAGPYGAGALTGMVNLRERNADGGRLDASIGNRNSRRFATALSHSGEKLAITVTGLDDRTDGYTPVRGPLAGRADVPMDMSAQAASLRLDTRISQRDVLSVRTATWEEDRGSGLGNNRANASGHSVSATLARQPVGRDLGWRVQLWETHSNLFNSSGAVSADRNTVTPANEQYRTPARGQGLNVALRQQAALATGTVEWEAGVDLRRARGSTQEMFRYMAGQFTRGRIAGGYTAVGGAYADVSWSDDKWLVAGGIRHDRWSNRDGVRIERDIQSGDITLDERDPERSGGVTSGRIGVRRALDGGYSVRASAYTAFRPATLNELHRPFRVGNDLTEANAGLKPETLKGMELSGALVRPRFSLDTTAFWNRIDDAIVNVTLAEGPGTFPRAGFVPAGGVLRQRRNAGTITAYGLEAQTRLTVTEQLQLTGAASWTHARMKGSEEVPQLTGLRPAQAPRWSGRVGMDWQPHDDVQVTAAARYESARFDDDLNSRRLAGAWTIDGRAQWRFDPHAALWIAGENLLDADIETSMTASGVAGYTAPRTVRLGVTLAY